MMTLIIAALMSLGIITAPEEASTQVITDNKQQIQAVIGEDFDQF